MIGTPSPFLVIVHPAGWVDFERQPAYWSEVPAAPACAATGNTISQVVDETERQLREWLAYLARNGRAAPGHENPRLDVLVAA